MTLVRCTLFARLEIGADRIIKIKPMQSFLDRLRIAVEHACGEVGNNAVRVIVVGGGNTAVEEALYLSNIASEVTVVHRRDALRAEKILQDHLLDKAEKGNVNMAWDSVLEEVLGDDSGVTGIRIKNVKDGSITDIEVSGVFIAIGHKPNTDIFEGQLDMAGGYIKVHSGSEGNATVTSVPGVFAAGDCTVKKYRQVTTAVADGTIASLSAAEYLLS